MTRPTRICSEPGCPEFAEGSTLCPKHLASQRAESDAARGPARQWYGKVEWRRLRAVVLKEEPTCRLCGNAPSTIADHIEPRSQRPDLELTRSNVRGVCKPCHDTRTATDNPIRGRADREPATKPEPRKWIIA